MNRRFPTTDRRGMLLLMVILMLSLFMAAGAMLLTLAARARAAARAHSQALQQTGISDSVARDALDAALLAAIRGSASGTNGSVTVSGSTASLENLLEDKYGSSFSGTGSTLSGTNSPVMWFTLSSTIPPAIARTLGGRIATIVPRADDPQAGAGDVSSYRILGVATSGTTGTCYLANLPGIATRRLPSNPFTVVINGREFTPVSGTTTPESYDAYDDANRWLAQPVPVNGQLSGTTGSFARLSFVGAGGTPTVDNDNDGVLDGTWIPPTITTGSATPPPFVIPDQPSPLGGTLRFQVSYLILDLDGRININAAGMAAPQGDYSFTAQTPIGMGYGPADINCSLLFPQTPPTVSGTYPPSGIWADLLQSGTPTTTPASPTPSQRRTPPVIGRIDGRSGVNAVPGVPGDDTAGNQQTSAAPNPSFNNESIYSLTISGPNAVGDVKAQTRAYMTTTASGSSQITPTLNFYRPAWTGNAGADAIDDPYEVRLDADAPKPGLPRRQSVAAVANDDAVFTMAELERILRPNDPDAPQLPQRLAAGLEDLAQQSRLTITTDSWSTPGLTGLAARQLENFFTGASFPANTSLSSSGTDGLVSPDVAAGLRFNINRPVLPGTSAAATAQQQQFCKDLYSLVMGLRTGSGPPPSPEEATQYAQWAVNVLDFRDADSIMTRFPYDTNLADGWQVNASSPVVYGAERPEVVIVETAAWRNTDSGTSQLFVNLHRPAATALLLAAGSGTTAVSGTTHVSTLAVSGTLQLTGPNHPWQLRFAPGSAVAFTDVGAAGTTADQWIATGTSVVSRPTNLSGGNLGPASGLTATGTGAYLCLHPSSPLQYSISQIPTLVVNQGGAFRFPATTASGTVYLERLADPGQPNSQTNPYVVVDKAVVDGIPNIAAAEPPAKQRRPGPADAPPPSAPPHALARFWRQPATWISGDTTLQPYSVTALNPVSWFHWPNRPFVSQAELALVPTGSTSTDGVLANYSFPTNSLATSTNSITIGGTTALLGSLILDATHVPSRFAENAVTTSGTSVNVVGLDRLQANHFSKWREPGRVNVNTIASGTMVSGTITPGGTPGSGRADDFVWGLLTGADAMTLQSGTSTFPVFSQPNPFVPPASGPVTPATSISHVLSLTGSASQPISTETFSTSGTFNPRDKNPYFNHARAIRLANTATVQSNVFAIWITVRITDDSPNAPSPITRRLFAIIDRSIPVGYLPNRDLNVRDTIRLKRHLE